MGRFGRTDVLTVVVVAVLTFEPHREPPQLPEHLRIRLWAESQLWDTLQCLEDHCALYGTYPEHLSHLSPSDPDRVIITSREQLSRFPIEDEFVDTLIYSPLEKGHSFVLGVFVLHTWLTPITKRFKCRPYAYLTSADGPLEKLPSVLPDALDQLHFVDERIAVAGRWSFWK
jgi:hypothetical protein